MLRVSVLLPYIPAVFVLLVAGLYIWQQRRDFKSTVDAYSRLLDRRDHEYEALSDRWYARQNLPPNKVELKTEYDEHKERAEQARVERKNGGPVTSAIGPADSVILEMEMEARRARASNPQA